MLDRLTIRKVDFEDELHFADLKLAHDLCFTRDEAGYPRQSKGWPTPFEGGLWFTLDTPVRAAVGLVGGFPAWHEKRAYHLSRIGVAARARGAGNALRLMRAFERGIRKMGLIHTTEIVSDCVCDNEAMANLFIRCGYRVYVPVTRWALVNSIYWRKTLS